LNTAKVDVLVWVLVYGGLILLGLGFALAGRDGALAWGIGTGGVVCTLLGALLVWVRSRMKER